MSAPIFENVALIECTDDGEPATIQLLTCSDCGAVVRGYTRDAHVAWHAKLSRVTGVPL
jgi:hypothetical protein